MKNVSKEIWIVFILIIFVVFLVVIRVSRDETVSVEKRNYVSTDVDSGTTDGTTADKLVDSSQNFVSTVTINDIARNGTDTTYAVVSAVDSNTVLSVSVDIFTSGETYTIESSAAAKARASLVLTDSMTITDGGPV